MISWLRRQMGNTSGGDKPPLAIHRTVEELSQSEAQLLELVENLREEVGRLKYEVDLSAQRCNHARAAHSAVHKQANELRADWPDIYRRYFTHAGITERREGRPSSARNHTKQPRRPR